MKPLLPFTDFESASTAVLNHLQSQLGFTLWMVTRAEGNDWIVLNAKDHGYEVRSGDVFLWTDSFCSRMVVGDGPRIAPRSVDVPAYADAPIGKQVPIGAYLGVPLSRNSGELFGTLCAINPSPMPESIVKDLPLVELMAQLLTTVLEQEFKIHQQRRELEYARSDAMTDGLTGIFNRRAWDEMLMQEEARCKRYGHSACVFSIDLNDLKMTNDNLGHAHGDLMLKRAANALQEATRESDIVARLGGDEFGIIAVECLPEMQRELLARISAALDSAAVSASIGVSQRSVSGSLEKAYDDADLEMYRRKHDRQPLHIRRKCPNNC